VFRFRFSSLLAVHIVNDYAVTGERIGKPLDRILMAGQASAARVRASTERMLR
jgi:hypothetical protein